jgi:hypothetical protein
MLFEFYTINRGVLGGGGGGSGAHAPDGRVQGPVKWPENDLEMKRIYFLSSINFKLLSQI